MGIRPNQALPLTRGRRWQPVLALVACVLLGACPARPKPPTRGSAPTPSSLDTHFVAGQRETLSRIIETVIRDNRAYQKLEVLCDTIGHRLSGSAALDRAIAWAVKTLENDGQQNVHTEKVMVPHWVRNAESLTMLVPVRRPLPMLGLGGSVGTGPGGVEAEVVVVDDRAALDALGEGAQGKIVLFNKKMPAYHPVRGTGYGETVKYRGHGASWAAKYGALATLVRSVTTRSLRTPHTGAMRYAKDVKKIPTAAITLEDADAIARLQRRGVKVRARLIMGANHRGLSPSANVIAELRGRERPEEIVLLGAHLDSWDVGQGAHDDGGGCAMAIEALSMLRKIKLRPRRTIRVVLFTNEENGLAGGKTYARSHRAELKHHVAAIEADTGVFTPKGFSVAIKDKATRGRVAARLATLLSLLSPLSATRVWQGHAGADIWPLEEATVPRFGLRMDLSTYFDYHHTSADTLDKIKPEDLSRATAALAAMAYILAELPDRIDAGPRR